MRTVTIAFTVLFSMLFVAGAAESAEPASDANRTWFAVEIITGPNWDPQLEAHEQAFFKDHSAHLQKLRAAGHIVMGTRYSDIGLLVFHSASIDAINKLMYVDPSMQAGTFSYEVHVMNVFYPGYVGNE